MLKKLVRIIHSIIWWITGVALMMLGIVLNAIIWPGNRKMYREYEHFWAWTLMKTGGIKLEIKGRKNLPQNEIVVYMANHQSHLDWPIVFRAVPGQYLFLAKQELFDVPVFGRYMRQQEYIPIERNSIRRFFKSYQKILDLIKSGNSIVIFPEGTRSFSDKLGKFRPSSFSFLQETKVKIVPLAIDGSINIIKKGSKIIYPGKVRVNILPPISFDDLYPLERKEFCLAASNRVRQVLLTVLEDKDLVPQKGIER